MAKLGVKFEATTEETENQGGSYEPLPHMYAELWATAIDLGDCDNGRGTQAQIDFEVTAPEEYKGKSFREWWTIDHADGSANKSYWKFGKPQLSRLGRAVGVQIGPDTDTDDITYKTFVAEVRFIPEAPNPKGGTYKAKNQIGRFFYTDEKAPEPVPTLGIIEGAPKPANDNRQPAANDNARPATAAGVKKTPW